MPIGQQAILTAALSHWQECLAEMSGVVWEKRDEWQWLAQKNKPMPPEAQVAAEALETWPCTMTFY